MDNSYLYYFSADTELDYRRHRPSQAVKPRRRRGTRSPWRRGRGAETTA